MVIMHNDGQHFSDTETGDVFGIRKTYSDDCAKWWIELDSAYDDISPVVLGGYTTQDDAMAALSELYNAHVNRLPSLKMP